MYFAEKLKGNHIRSTTNIPLPVVSNNTALTPVAHTGCNFSKNSLNNSSSNYNPLRKYSNVDIEGMKSRPHTLGMDEGHSSNGREYGIIIKPQNYGGAPKSHSKKSVNLLSAVEDGKSGLKVTNLRRGEGESDDNLKRPDHVVTTTNVEKVTSKSIDNRKFQNTSSPESGSFNAADYKGERTYF